MQKQFTRILSVVLAMLMLCTSVPLTAEAAYTIESGKCGDNITWVIDSDDTLTISGTGDMPDYSSSSYAPWHEYLSYVRKAIIETGVTSIGEKAFYECGSLTSITIPETVTSIGEYAFSWCNNLTDITLPNNIKTISRNMFEYCRKLTSITIPTSVTKIDNYAFLHCEKLTSIIIPDTVTSIGENAFYYCTNLNSISLSSNITAISYEMFRNCISLKSIIIPDSVKTIDTDAFRNCTSLENIILSDSLENIGLRAFYDCTSLESITILNPECEIYDTEDTIDPVATIYCYPGSTAQAYAEKYNRTFVALEEDNSEEILNALSYEINDGEVTITDCDTSFAGDMVIPDTIEGYPVTSIGDYAFYCCSYLTSITISNSVTSIGWFAFDCCNRLTSVTIGDSVISIGNYAFEHCYSLTSVTIGDSVTSIGPYAFAYCNSLTSITIPNSVTSIGYQAFFYCSSLTSITIPDSVTSIGNAAFSNCGLTSMTIPDSVTSIGDSAFYCCESLIDITIGNSVTSIGDSAFDGCISLTNVTIPDSVTSIGWSAFDGCILLTSVIIGDSVTSIGNYAFDFCDSLTSVTIGNSVTSIGDYTFRYCTSLKSITIPNSVTTIGDYAFQYCYSLTSVTINNPDCEIYDSQYTIDSGATIYGYEGSTAQAYAEKYDRNFVSIVNILDYLAYEIKNEEVTITDCDESISGNVVIPDTIEGYPVTAIGGYAFYSCESLTSITILNPDCEIYDSEDTIYSGTTIYGYSGSTAEAYAEKYDRAFVTLDGECSHFYTTVVTPSSCTEQGYTTYTCFGCGYSYVSDYEKATGHQNYVSDNCCDICGIMVFRYYVNDCEVTITGCYTSVNGDVVIPETIAGYPVTTIGEHAFAGCDNLESVTIGNSVTTIEEYAFAWCSNLKSITIPDSVTTIGDYAFCLCSNLTNVTIGNSVTTIGDAAFSSCVKLTSITIPDSVITIGNSAFSNCDSLKSVTIGNSVTTIDAYAFSFCGNLTGITIPDSVTTIGFGAFSNCDSLESVAIGNSVTTIEGYAFAWCSNLKSITIPDSVTTIGDYAFCLCSNLTNVTIGNSVTTIGNVVFKDCDSLKSIIIYNPESEIYDNYNTIHSGVTIYGYLGSTAEAYAEKYNRTFVALEEDNSEEILNALSYEINDGEVTITDCDESISGNVVIPETIDGYPVTTIRDWAFEYCYNLTSVTIPESVTLICENTFFGCSGLTEILVDADNKYFCSDDGVLFNKDRTELILYPMGKTDASYVISDTVKTIGYHAFSGCNNLTSITIPDSVTNIGDYAFECCNSLKNVTLSNSITSIGFSTFIYCTSLESITIPESVTNIDGWAFSECTSLTSITIPESVISIEDFAFYNCSSLESINIPDSVTIIDNYVFRNCSSLESITIHNNITSIGEYAFDKCYSLKNITIGNGVTTIGEGAFRKCSSLKNISYTGTCAQWKKINISLDNDILESVKIDHKTVVTVKGKAATCTATGLTEGKHCSVCNTVITAQKTVAKKAHTYKTTTTPATLAKSGSVKTSCKVCGFVKSNTQIRYVKTVSLSTTSYTYDGAVKTPAVTVKDANGKTLKNGTDYSVSYASGRKNAGTYKVTVTLKGNYSGSKTLTFKINPISISKCTVKLSATSFTYNGSVKTPTVTVKSPKGTTLTKGTHYTVTYASGRKSVGAYKVTVTMKGNYSGTKILYMYILPSKTSKITPTATTTTLKATWNKVTGASGYRVELLNASGKVVKKVTTSKLTYTFSGLSAGTTYKVRVSAYKTISGVNKYSLSSTTLTTATKPATPTLKVSSTTKGKANLSWTNVAGETGYQVYYSTNNKTFTKIASYSTNTVKSSKSKLTSGKTYYFKVRSYKKVGSTVVYGAWSSVKSVKIK